MCRRLDSLDLLRGLMVMLMALRRWQVRYFEDQPSWSPTFFTGKILQYRGKVLPVVGL